MTVFPEECIVTKIVFMINVVYLQSEQEGWMTLQSISDRVEKICGKIPSVLHVYTDGMYKDFLSFDSVDFVLFDNFFNRTENCDLKIVPEVRQRFPGAVIVAFSIFNVVDRSIYDIVIETEVDDGKAFDLLCHKIAEKIKSA